LSRVEEYSHIVLYVLKKYFGGGSEVAKHHHIEVEDLSQMGMIGLIKADRDFNPDEATSFFTYAVHKVRYQISRELRDDNPCIKFPRTVKDLAATVDRSLPLTIESIMNQKQVNRKMALSILDFITQNAASMNQVMWDDYATGDKVTMQDMLSSDEDILGTLIRKVEARERWEMLSLRQRQIFQLTFTGMSQSAISKEVGLSQSRVSRQISNACKQLEKAT
jgi:RNA polymerase sporulation-specific sigma factor